MIILNASEAAASKKNIKPSFRRKRLAFTVFPNDVPEIKVADLVAIRQSVQLTQPEFSKVLGVSLSIYSKWEAQCAPIPKSIQHFVFLIGKNPALVHEFVTIKKNDPQTLLLSE